jgi:arsenite methyltransferase
MGQAGDLKKADYGIDAPGVVRNFALLGVWLVVLAAVLKLALSPYQPALAVALAHTCFWPGLWFTLTAVAMIWGSKVGKLRVRDRLLDAMPWRGDEQVLDVGCGRGLMLLGAAKRLTTGKAVGIDLWQTQDQSGNSPDTTRANARAEGVAERVELHTGDARQLPFADGTFDVVVSSWALHNIYDAEGRRQAVGEIARVLKPGGRVALVDIRHTTEYADALRAAGLADVTRSGPSFVFVIPSFRVTGRKPLPAGEGQP